MKDAIIVRDNWIYRVWQLSDNTVIRQRKKISEEKLNKFKISSKIEFSTWEIIIELIGRDKTVEAVAIVMSILKLNLDEAREYMQKFNCWPLDFEQNEIQEFKKVQDHSRFQNLEPAIAVKDNWLFQSWKFEHSGVRTKLKHLAQKQAIAFRYDSLITYQEWRRIHRLIAKYEPHVAILEVMKILETDSEEEVELHMKKFDCWPPDFPDWQKLK